MGRRNRVGSGRVPTCVGLVVVLAVLLIAPAASAQPERRVSDLIGDPFGLSSSTGELMPSVSPVPPRTAYQPPQPPDEAPAADPAAPLPPGAPVPVPQSKAPRHITFGPRYGTRTNQESVRLPDGTRRFLLTGGWVVNVAAQGTNEATEFAADDVVIWVRGLAIDNVQQGIVTQGGGGNGKPEVEVYLAGNVIIRSVRGTPAKPITQTLRAEEVYYDVDNNRSVALRADLEMSIPLVRDAFHLRGDEIRRLDLENWEVLTASANASKLPSDPGLRLDSQRFTLSERRVVPRNIFGIPYRNIKTGDLIESREMIVTGTNVVTRLGGVPVFYSPTLRTNAADPLGPFQGFGFSDNRIFGLQYYTTWDMYKLLALRPPDDHNWRLNLDYLSKRGFAYGTTYSYRVHGDEPGDPPIGVGLIRFYGLEDKGFDILGGNRGIQPMPPLFRDRFLWRHQQEITDDLYFQGQLAYLSDKNFLEEYYKNEYDFGPNQETFAYFDWKKRNYGATLQIEDRFFRRWVDETNTLPRLDGFLLGQTFLDDWFVYSTRGSAEYAESRPSEELPYPLLSTDRKINTGRFDWWQELDAPLALGPVKFAPYGILELTEYTSDLNGNEIGRIYGAGGARASLPFSRLYSDVVSELMNLHGLYHKIVFGATYRYARTNVPYGQLPLLDRLNDDATDESWRYITPQQSLLIGGPNGAAIQNAPGYSVFNPQLYAIRRVVENNIDTLDNINVLQMDVRQRFQTKRGYPGMEHTVDFLTLDVSASYFPHATRDNFGHPFSFLEYAALWNVGDRTAVVSNGWFEPYQGGTSYWNAGVYLNRTDRTSIYLGYRQTDPLNSKAVTGTLSYQMSPRYYVNLGVSYDLGLGQSLSNSISFTRTGSDLTVNFGLSYNPFVNTFSFQFLILPNLVYGRMNVGAVSGQQLTGR